MLTIELVGSNYVWVYRTPHTETFDIHTSLTRSEDAQLT